MPIWDGQDRDEATAGFRFLGQRFTLDAPVFQQLIYPAVQPDEAGGQRMLPDALDLPAAFGSDTALQILTEQGEAAYPGYTENLESLRAALEKAPAATWSASLYAAWLDALRPLAEEKGEGWPQYMQSEAWAKKDLATMLGSWAELKHDTALYAKQVYAEMGGGGIEPVDDRGYVEAEPAVFGKLSALCTATANGLDALGLLSDTQAADLAKMAELNRQLMTIAEKELRGELPTDEEFELIRSFGGQLEHFWTEAVADEAAGIYTPMQMAGRPGGRRRDRPERQRAAGRHRHPDDLCRRRGGWQPAAGERHGVRLLPVRPADGRAADRRRMAGAAWPEL